MSAERHALPAAVAPVTPDVPIAGHAARAVVRTVAYAALFQAPLTRERLHRALMDVRLDPRALDDTLADPWVRGRVEVSGDLVFPRGRGEWIEARGSRRHQTERLLWRHRRALALVARCPFVRLVGLSGGCAHENATDGDVDVFLVTRRGRAWAVYLALILASRLLRVRRTLCINYVVDETELALSERDVFTASELVGLRPLAGLEAYHRLVQVNDWVADWFPNFFHDRHAADASGLPPAGGPRWLERVLDLGPAQALQRLSRRLIGARLRRKARGAAGLALAEGRLKLHLVDHRPRLLAAWREAQKGAGLDDDGGLGAQPHGGVSPQGPSDGIHFRREPPKERP